MKLRKTLLSFACAIMVALSFTACGDDWGRQDDPAGGQIYPSKATVATYDFEYSEEKPEYSDMISHDESCEVTNDETLSYGCINLYSESDGSAILQLHTIERIGNLGTTLTIDVQYITCEGLIIGHLT